MIDRRKEERRKMQTLIKMDRRLCERREQLAMEASGITCVNEFRKRQRHTLGAIHYDGRIVL